MDRTLAVMTFASSDDDFGTDTTLAHFQVFETMQLEKDKLKRTHKGSAMTCNIVLHRFLGMSEEDLWGFKWSSAVKTS